MGVTIFFEEKKHMLCANANHTQPTKSKIKMSLLSEYNYMDKYLPLINK